MDLLSDLTQALNAASHLNINFESIYVKLLIPV